MGPVWQRVPVGLPRNFYAAAGSLDSGLVVGHHLPVGRLFRWSCVGGGGVRRGGRGLVRTTVRACWAGELLNALGLWKEAVWEGHLGPEVNGAGWVATWAFWFGLEILFWKLD